MKRIIIVPFIILILFAGCVQRESLYELARLSISEIPTVVVADPEGSILSIPTNTLISVLFSLPMDTDSVEKAFHLSYDSTELDETDGNFYWLNNNRLFVFELISPLPQFVEVTAVINFTAQSNEGINLKDAYRWTFTVSDTTYGGSPTAGVLSPAVDDVVFPDHTFEINFDRAMLRSTVEASFLLIADDFSDFRTVDEGSFTWSGTTVYYTTNTPLIENKRYFIYFNNNGVPCLDLAGNGLSGYVPVSFYTVDQAVYVSLTFGNPANAGYHWTQPVTSINDAIVLAKARGYIRIKIAMSSYNEDIDLNGTDNFRFEGGYDDFTPGWPRSFIFPTEIYPGINNMYAFNLTGVSNVMLDRLKIYGNGIALGGNRGAVMISGNSSNITIRNCVLYGTTLFLPIVGDAYGVNADSSSFRIENSTVYGAGIPVTGHVYGVRSVNSTATIMNSSVNALDIAAGATGSSYGIYLGQNPSAEIAFSWINDNSKGGDSQSIGIESLNSKLNLHDNFTIRGGDSSAGNSFAVSLDSSFDSIIRNNNVIEGGDSNNALSGGIIIDTSTNTLIENNGLIFGGWGTNTSKGIYASDSSNLTISGNTTIIGGKTTIDHFGIHIGTGNSGVIINGNGNIIGAQISAFGSDIGIQVDDSSVTVSGNTSIVGNSSGNSASNVGLLLKGSNNNSIIENNALIQGGTTGPGQTYGMVVDLAAKPTIRDNKLITPGENSNFDTYGIWVINGAVPKIYRNMIRGGTELGNNKNQYGVKYENAGPGINGGTLINNFIIGSDNTTQSNNIGYAVHLINTNIKLLNNTLIGTVRPGGSGDSYAFYGESTNTWIINNIIIGGLSGNKKYGLFFDDIISPSPSDGTVIYNNIFDQDKCDDYLYDGTSGGGNNVAADVNGQPFFTINPDFNKEYNNTDGVVYAGGPYDYHVLSDLNNKLRGQGYSSTIDPFKFSTYGTIYNEEGALFDIDNEAKSTNYGKIDFGADEFDFN
jgi:hypothetical protein